MKNKKRIAVIGGGVAGLTAAYLLRRKHDVTLYERTTRLGGNAYTYTTRDGENLDIAVAVFGRAGYPSFYGLLAELGVKTTPALNAYMAFHNLDTRDGIYLTPSLKGLLTQNTRFFKPQNWKALASLLSGLRKARALGRGEGLEDLNVGQLLDKLGTDPDGRVVLICAFCLLSSMSAAEVLASPARFFVDKLETHSDVLSPKAVYSLRAVEGGTRTYVDALARGTTAVLGAKVKTVKRGTAPDADGVTLSFEDRADETFDGVVMACNPDQALKLLEAPSAEERALLGAWRYKDGRVVLHRDHSSFPPKELIQAYTFLYTRRGDTFETSVNGALWYEPSATKRCEYISSQHPNFPIREDLIEFDTVLRTPIFDLGSLATVPKLRKLNGTRGTFYCGSYFGFGLHEDAVTSAIQVAKKLGVAFDPPQATRAQEVGEVIGGIWGKLREWR